MRTAELKRLRSWFCLASGRRAAVRVEVEASSDWNLRDFLHALQSEKCKGSEVTVEHEADETVSLYRVRGENAAGFACELVSGGPTVFSRGRRVDLDEAV